METQSLSRDLRIIEKLESVQSPSVTRLDPDIAPLFPGFGFNEKLVAGITPIKSGGLLDFVIDRPGGLNGWILNVTVKGQGRVFDGADAFDVFVGDLLLFPPNVVHYYRRHPDADFWWHRWIYFQPRGNWLRWLDWRNKVNGVACIRMKDQVAYQEQEKLFVDIAAWHGGMDWIAEEQAINLLERLILICLRMDAPEGRPSAIDERLRVACKYITANLHVPLTVAEIAETVHLSSSRLTHLFTSQFGCGPLHWRDVQRIQTACQSLQMTETPIKIIAAQVGYEDPLYFARVFHKHTGTSPGQFRERHRATH